MSELVQIAPATYEVKQEGGMRVPGLVIATQALMDAMEFDRPLEQVCNVAHLPGIVGHSIAMPDIHWGYGFPIGGVAAMDVDEGVISPGGVGYDINCGVRLAVVPESFEALSGRVGEELIQRIYELVPSGVGKGHRGTRGLSERDYEEIARHGARFSVEKGAGFAEDLERSESHGFIEGADPKAVSAAAKARGKNQLGTIGSGNHFVEVGKIEELFLPEVAKAWGIEQGQIYLLIHSGSRGFGHQVCQDTLDHFLSQGFAEGLPDPQLVCAPIKSSEGQQYYAGLSRRISR